MTKDEFIDREVTTWGQAYIFDLIDRGFSPILLVNGAGNERWTWVLSNASQVPNVSPLRSETACAIVASGGSSKVPSR